MKNINKKRKFNKKYIAFGIIGVFAMVLVSAGILIYYGQVSATLNIDQAIDVNGIVEFTDVYDIDCDSGEFCYGEVLNIHNSGDSDKTVTISTTGCEDEADVSYVGKMTFTHKDLYTGIASGATEEVVYTVTGDTFVATGIPEGYKLVYYPDTGVFLDNVANILIYGEDTFSDLPDTNIDVGDDYCNILTGDSLGLANPTAKVCSGAKLWLVEEGYITALKLGTWTPSMIMFETDLTTYTVSSTGEVLIPSGSAIAVYPQFTIEDLAYNTCTATITID